MSQAGRTSERNGRFWGMRARHWAEIQEKTALPAFEAVQDELQIGPSTRYLDLGCGAGMAVARAAKLGATVSGVDASSALLEIAGERTPAGQFHCADLEELPFADGHFDAVTSFNAVQYAGDPIAALREAGRVAKPGGSVAAVTWGPPENMELASVMAAVKPFMPPPPGAPFPGPFALSGEDTLREFAKSAGLMVRKVADIDAPWHYPDMETALTGAMSSGVSQVAIERAGEDAVRDAHVAAFTPFRQNDGSYRIGATLRCLYAESP